MRSVLPKRQFNILCAGLIVGAGALTLASSSSTAKAESGHRYSAFPSFSYYDVDKELRKRNIPVEDTSITANKVTAPIEPSKNSVFVVEQKLTDFLRMAAQRHNVRVNISPRLHGTVRNLDLPSNLDGMLTKLSDHFEFDWYQDADTLHVSERSQNTTKVISLGRSSYKDLKRTFKSIGLKGKGYSIRHVEDSNSVLVTGPASLIAKIEVLVASKIDNGSNPKLIKFGVEN